MLPIQTKEEIGNRIRDIRISKQLTQTEFAESINISINFLSEIENGKKGMSYETLYTLCYVHSVSADYVLFGTCDDAPKYQQIIDICNTLSERELHCLINYANALTELKFKNETI